jgi:hypothetical protein
MRDRAVFFKRSISGVEIGARDESEAMEGERSEGISRCGNEDR